MGSYETELARKSAWRKIHTTCPCGREVYGNGKSHQRNCHTHLQVNGWPLDDQMVQAVIDEYHGRDPVARIRAAEMELGRIYLERRARGDKTSLPWKQYRDTVWAATENPTP
ncbi:hypothetical protein BTO20_37540 (plasmid) [Mycobacterium dioxanotrophicus]|jgi:hypothetical protein|uniref:Uncharacterized protein n=1 Tax=Mycobacterium dioxanotrophicus TaxID=482462 RepID=A0A1Y0CGB7_9MYCO|nr:hypothetical protein [Mycobacterium dioxanotrophicus]ART74329.1 hypothetical protein BTO20_37540 [Mycobacterium dioxanotrophicus]